MKRILIADTYYPDFLKTLDIDPNAWYVDQLSHVLYQSFGTGDFYSRGLAGLGWDAIDIIANCEPLQELWGRNRKLGSTLQDQIDYYRPDVVFLQDLSLVDQLTRQRTYIVAGQCSCPMPADSQIRQFDILFTSFPHYIERFERLGVKAVFNPLGFDPMVLKRTTAPIERDIDVSFVGGVGAPSHWRYGMKVLNAVAEAIPTFKWWGYGAECLPSNSALLDKYQGEAWGLKMYDILRRSKIVLNRHGEVAEDYANNMRMFEATGCGALLVTEQKDNLGDYFAQDEVIDYGSAQHAVDIIRHYLNSRIFMDGTDPAQIAARGQARTLKDHTYARRMETVSDSLLSLKHTVHIPA